MPSAVIYFQSTPAFKIKPDTGEKLSYAAVASCSAGTSKSSAQTIDLPKQCRGSREIGEITIESKRCKKLRYDIKKTSFELASSASGKSALKESYFKPIDNEGIGSPRPGSGCASTRPKSYSPTFRGSPTLHFYSGNPSLKDDVSRSELICMLAVPAKLTIHDICKFTAPVGEYMEYMRIIRDVTPNQYMVLLKFKNQKFADEFYSTYNNTQYNTIEPDTCHLIYVAQLEILKENEDPSLPVPGITELPNCPVCLERMDESVDGILTILCNHAFHMTCLVTVGRYKSLWICLICGHVGCGRYSGQHAYRHFEETQHTYAMQLGNNAVWDYAGDNYVHRLVQNKGDGKLVEVDERGNYVQEEKIDSLQLEVEKLDTKFQKSLHDTEQLNIKLSEVSKEKQTAEKKCTHLHTRLTKTLKELQEEQEINKSLRVNQDAWQKKVTKLEAQVHDLTKEKEREIQDLREQLRDVMFFLEAQKKLSDTNVVSQQEIEESQIYVGASGTTPSPTGRRGRKKDR
ncbi:hypothetical protein KUTeg_010085 [Tegillarca granosa]|uniref:BRCA1-associated protein n=1 Tax=Tegillarca granosa TaxID=220873 RepID=A0ABQ9F5Q3_TEGGR|nr:hypothetical protein KUTeg_010085 [Tegillarca granosa]